MPSKVALALRAYCVAGSLALCAVAAAADRNSPLIGATRDEVLARFGEPKSQIVAGPRQILFFAKERVVLRDNRVVEVEEIQAEAPPAPKPVAKPDASATAAVPDATEPTADGTPAPAARTVTEGPTGETGSEPASAPKVAPQPEVLIKSVRPPSRTAAPTSPSATFTSPAAGLLAPAPAVPPTTAAPAPTAPAERTPPRTLPNAAATPASVASTPAEPPVQTASPVDPHESKPAAAEPVAAIAAPSAAAETPAPSTSGAAKPAASAPKRVRADANRQQVTDADAFKSGFTTTNKVIGVAVILIGIGYLAWRRRQRNLLLEVTAVSRSPFVADAPATATAAKFTPELLEKLEWCRFEELVAAYYNKTGVVASRTKNGPDGAVHIRISWKGEQRPFACVQCIASPRDLVGPKQVQALCDVLAADDIRRGYIVTPGKFSVPARDLAEEKHVTLLPGDIFLEKLNALPEPVRSELLRDATVGDYMTPTCPKCEIKTVRADGSGWKCVQCGTEVAS